LSELVDSSKLETVAIDVQHLAELATTLGSEKFENLLTLLVVDLRKQVTQLKCRGHAVEIAPLRSGMHNFKGMAASFGLRGVASAARAIEFATRGQEVESAFGHLQDEIEYALAWIMARADWRLSRDCCSKYG
jgi:HPt (histidine-containing phosphotransfer) domain-containing protein